MKLNISKSLINAWEGYHLGDDCGVLFKAMYIDKTVDSVPGPAARLGQWFEYMITGEKPRNGECPIPGFLSRYKGEAELWDDLLKVEKGKLPDWPVLVAESLEKLTAPYRYALAQANVCRRAFEHYDITDIQSGVTWEFFHDGVNSKAILDVFGKMLGEEAIIDIKSTGFLHNKWEDYGWAYERIAEKPKLLIQVIHSVWLGTKIYGKKFPFYFFVHSTKSDYDSVIYRVDVDDVTLADHETRPKYVYDMLEYTLEAGFDARPDIMRCMDCPLRAECKSATAVPVIKRISI